jgi:hypothetical protein
MIKLEQTFTSAAGGFGADTLKYIQVIRSDKAAVYERSRDGIVKDWEAIKIKVIPANTVQKFPNGVTKTTTEDEEMYATASGWGKSGFSFHGANGKQAAINKFNELNTAQAVKDDEPVAVNVPSKFNNTTFVFPATFSIKDFAETNKCEYITASLFVKEQIAAGSVKQVGEERRAAKGPMSKIYSKV